MGSSRLIENCGELRSRWHAYIESGFGAETVQPYCLAYWSLLEDLVEVATAANTSPAVRQAITAAATFESFSVIDVRGKRLAAATTTLRNPVYLLARLKWPTVPHTMRFLPLIALKDAAPSTFGHYRRYPLSDDGDLSLLVYPTNQAGGDRASMSVISGLANRLGSSSDPLVADRSHRLWDHAVRPLLEQHAPEQGAATFDFFDLGAGTGALTAELCRKLVAWATGEGIDPRLRFILIDSSGTALSDTFADPAVRAATEGLSRMPVDYRAWLAQRHDPPSRRGMRLGLACKILDMSSAFEVRPLRRSELPTPSASDRWFSPAERSPAKWLATLRTNPDDLLTSAVRFQVADGHVLAQPALSRYFAALTLVADDAQIGGELYLPVRRFDPSALITSAGASVLAEMLKRCDFLIIEDADLRPRELAEHMRKFELHDIMVEDMTAAMRLAGNYAYVLSRKEARNGFQLGGERVI
ncbi:MAG: hypothetical protein WEB52_01235 [Dehalococcoidia bacterium]